MKSSLSKFTERLVSSSRKGQTALSVRSAEAPTFQFSNSLRRQYATALPITATGPPPRPPVPAEYGERVERRRRQAEMLKQEKSSAHTNKTPGKSSPMRKRFWKEVHVKETPQGYQVYLDTRPVRTPSKSILTVPLSKPHLAHAIALEWDLLSSGQQALKNHNIPMTSLVSRAQAILEEEAEGNTRMRGDIIKVLMRYLDTDTLICWTPETSVHDAMQTEMHESRTESLRSIQMRTAKSILGYLNTSVWPGVEIRPVLDEDSILPNKQSEVTRSIIQGWIAGLPAYELAALERAVLAGKSLLVATRLLIEWSEEFRDLQRPGGGKEEEGGDSEKNKRFGIEEAAEASTLEVRWQTGMWGEVEDTHDVDREDIRRQLGGAVLMVSGTGK